MKTLFIIEVPDTTNANGKTPVTIKPYDPRRLNGKLGTAVASTIGDLRRDVLQLVKGDN